MCWWSGSPFALLAGMGCTSIWMVLSPVGVPVSSASSRRVAFRWSRRPPGGRRQEPLGGRELVDGEDHAGGRVPAELLAGGEINSGVEEVEGGWGRASPLGSSSGCRAEATRVDEDSHGFAVVSCAPDDGKLTGRQTGDRSTDEVFSLVDLGVTRREEDYPES